MQTLTLPKGGKTMEEGTVVEWLLEEGEPVSAGEPVLHFESDKATSEITADEDGVLLERSVAEGVTVPVGTELGRIGSDDEAIEGADTAGTEPTDGEPDPAGKPEGEPDPGSKPKPNSDPAGAAPRATPSARRIARERGVSLSAVAAETGVRQITRDDVEAYTPVGADTNGDDVTTAAEPDELTVEPVSNPEDGDVLGSPWARVLAANHGIPLSAVADETGTDRVRASDVAAYVENEPREPGPEPTGPGPDAAVGTEPVTGSIDEPAIAREGPPTGARGVMFDRMSTVANEYASTTTVARVDVTDLVSLYDQLSAAWGEDVPLSLTAFVVRAVARSLPEHDVLNAEVTSEENVRVYEDINVGIAVDTDEGLLVPTIYDADDRTVRALSREIDRLASGARDGTLDHDDMQNGTFTVSNAGNLGAYINTPQINPPQTAVLGMCAIVDEPGVVDGEVVPRKMMHLTLTYDHRVVEGATAVGFLRTVKSLLESPESLLS
jgi:pyruvate/2-oxoglutarate dehydrogenase complex dihydrolipoamide acyltransferase (E2) component